MNKLDKTNTLRISGILITIIGVLAVIATSNIAQAVRRLFADFGAPLSVFTTLSVDFSPIWTVVGSLLFIAAGIYLFYTADKTFTNKKLINSLVAAGVIGATALTVVMGISLFFPLYQLSSYIN